MAGFALVDINYKYYYKIISTSSYNIIILL
jgi:hypothetical protein